MLRQYSEGVGFMPELASIPSACPEGRTNTLGERIPRGILQRIGGDLSTTIKKTPRSETPRRQQGVIFLPLWGSHDGGATISTRTRTDHQLRHHQHQTTKQAWCSHKPSCSNLRPGGIGKRTENLGRFQKLRGHSTKKFQDNTGAPGALSRVLWCTV